MRGGIALATLAIVCASVGCRLHPLVSDMPGASVNILPAGSVVPSVTDNAELMTQIQLNDGLDPKVLAMTGGVVVPGTGMSAGTAVSFWSFGAATRAPSPLYVFFSDDGSGPQPISHPPLAAAVPGDTRYNAIHNLYQVVVTDTYDGELMTTTAALDDAVELGLVAEPVPLASFVNGPIVLPGTTLGVGAGPPANPQDVYADGYVVELFRFGGPLGVEPNNMVLPTSQVSYLREAMKTTYDATQPIFQATIPTMVATTKANYTPLSIVVDVDLAPGVTPAMITQDSDLFVRSAAGVATATTANVAQFTVTTTSLDLQLQFMADQP